MCIRDRARGGAGLVIQEATCISKEGRLSLDQLGIWEDEQIPGLKKIVDAVHEEGVPIFVQIHHAGVIAAPESRVCPSEYTCVHKGIEKHGRELTVSEIHEIEEEFIQAARRALDVYKRQVLDRSGSMAGSPLTNMKAGAKTFIDIIDEATDGA